MKKIISTTILALSFNLIANTANTLDYPHAGLNSIGCNSCHFVFETEPSLLPPWTSQPPQDIDDTAYNKLCRSCHNDIDAPRMKTHSSLQIDNGYGDWTVECKTCHNPHYQKQFRTYGSVSYLYQGTVSSVTTTTLTRSGANWTTDQYKGLIVVPNISKKDYNYRITGNTEDTLTVEGPIKLTQVSVGNTFAIIYGKLVKEIIPTPNSGDKAVRFFNSTGTNSFADGNATYDGVCEVCHTQTTHFRNNGTGTDQLHSNMNYPAGTNCADCHKHVNGFGGMGGGAHTTHVTEGYGPQLQCADCHGTNNPPVLADGQNLANTTVCTNCHSANGAATAKQYWSTKGSSQRTDGSWAVVEGEESFCGSCHDETPGNTKGDGTGGNAPNIIGNNTTYGFFVTGHGKSTGNYPGLSWQDTSATGNPAANLQRCGQCHGIPPFDEYGWPNPPFPPTPPVTPCSFCHDLTTAHYNTANKRLRSGFENDQNNTNCKQCHSFDNSEGTAATSAPHFYTTSADYENSAHKNILCTQCHDVHGASGAIIGMTKLNQEALCFNCHKDPVSGGIQNNAISGASLADDIQQAFGMSNKHDLGASFTISGKTYSLQCISCHNVHTVTGKYWDADIGLTPVTRFGEDALGNQRNLGSYGDKTGEKMKDYGGTYITPKDEQFNKDQLPNYTQFCQDCHEPMKSPLEDPNQHGDVGFNTDPHGLLSANNTAGTSFPNWYASRFAEGWQSLHTEDPNFSIPADKNNGAFPVYTAGRSEGVWIRAPFKQEERMAGANYVLSCTNCHEAHGSSNSSMIRTNPNGKNVNFNTGFFPGSTWRTLCTSCHFMFSDWHADNSNMSDSYTAYLNREPGDIWFGCGYGGTAACHGVSPRSAAVGAGTLHQMYFPGTQNGTRIWNPDLVVDMRFENNNLNDSGSWYMHGRWQSQYEGGGAGSFVDGKSEQAIELNGDQLVEPGTTDGSWSTDEGAHGTWKYTEMRDNMTLEAWVSPTANVNNEYHLITKHTYYTGGYAFMLKNINGTLRAALMTNISGLSGDFRGAFSTVAVPLNKWTHVAATFDKNGPDKDTNDLTKGRIRIYVNGEDVTTSYADNSTQLAEPGAGENAMYPESSHRDTDTRVPGDPGWQWYGSTLTIGGRAWTSGSRAGLVGKIDEVKVWNITKNAAYFSQYDSQSGPYISEVLGMVGSNQLTVRFSEGVYTNTSSSGALVPGDFVLTDAGNDNPRTIAINGVTHTAGSAIATITMIQPLIAADINADTLAAASNNIFDNYNNAADTTAVTITAPQLSCPTSPVTINLNEASGSTYVYDTQSELYGTVYGGAATLTGSEYSGGGDGSGRYIKFLYNNSCLLASTALTIETRIKPTALAGTGTYLRRILDRTANSGNYQISVWRNNSAANIGVSGTPPGSYNAPSGEASIALWVYVVDAHGGANWKPVLTNYSGAKNGLENDCPIVSDHWYQVKAVWNTNKPGGTTGQPFTPADIYVDDQGTDGNGAGEGWAGYLNCTDTDQSLKASAVKFYTADQIATVNGLFAIGQNGADANLFNGLIDWIRWNDAIE